MLVFALVTKKVEIEDESANFARKLRKSLSLVYSIVKHFILNHRIPQNLVVLNKYFAKNLVGKSIVRE